MAAGAITIGYTTFIQGELKSDINDIKEWTKTLENQQKIETEKITNIQITMAKLEQKLTDLLAKDLILSSYESKN
jgi:hypothetical protein